MNGRLHSVVSGLSLVALLLAALIAATCTPSAKGNPGVPPEDPVEIESNFDAQPMTERWKELDRLVEEQKFEAASQLATEIREAAREAGEVEDWTRGLIREVQLRTGLHGFETAVRFLRDEPWPEEPLSASVLELFYAHSLQTYLQAYSWEIRQRERVSTGGELDLKAWTAEQIAEEVHRSYARLWERRGSWGGESLGRLAEYLEQNQYPARVRGTLRDAVTYLWAATLENSSLWSPEQTNSRHALDLGGLLERDSPPEGEPDLTDPSVHPLVKAAAVLGDLERWHRSKERPEAAFEAELQRVRILRGHFSRADDRQTIREHLSRRLDELGRRFEWWSTGMALLAELVRDDADSPDRLVRARQIALEGATAHPESFGGRRCAHIVGAIEAPSYSLSAMLTDGPRKRSVGVSHKNLSKLYFRAYPLDLLQAVSSSRDYNLLPRRREIEAILAKQQPASEWTDELPETTDYQSHRTWVTPPLDDPGLYLIVASARADFAEEGNRRAATNLIVSDLVVLRRILGQEQEVTVRSGASGEPLRGVRVSFYRYDYRKGHTRVGTLTTDSGGLVTSRDRKSSGQGTFVVAQLGDDVGLDAARLRGYPSGRGERSKQALLYTDRTVYRPRQTVKWKVVAYEDESDAGRFATVRGADVSVELKDPNGEVVAEQEVTTNRFGTASGEFEIPGGRLLGAWGLETSHGGYSWIQVEEYKRPTFEVEILEPEVPLRLNRPARLAGEARYYFGLPVVDGDVEWRVQREPVYPRWWFWQPPRTQTEVVAAGSTSLDAEGRFEIEFEASADERDAETPGISYRYRLSADVTDEGGETRSATRAFRLGFVAVEAPISADTSFVRAGEPVGVTVRRSDLDGVPLAGAGTWRLLRLDQPGRALLPAEEPLPEPLGGGLQTPGDRLRPRWEAGYDPARTLRGWQDGREIGAGEVEHGDDGAAEIGLGELEPGAYRVRYSTEDPFGAVAESQHELLVVEPGETSLELPAILRVDRRSVPVGGTSRLLVHSGLESQAITLELFRGGERFDRRELDSATGLQVIEIPIEAKDRGGFSVRLSALRDHQLMVLSESVLVPWDDRRLELEFASFRDLMRPGGRESWRVTVRDHEGGALESGAAELLAYMYDRSLDLFAPHRPPDPLGLYPRRTGLGRLNSSLDSQGEAWSRSVDFTDVPTYPHLQPDRLKFYDGYGIGGMGRRMARRMEIPKAAAMQAEGSDEVALGIPEPPPAADVTTVTSESPLLAEGDDRQVPMPDPTPDEEPAPADTLRTDFSETAFWEPHLLLADDGSVSFEFTVPDSVTEWNVWVHGVTRDLRSGSISERSRSVRELMVRPYLPRFFREGDRATLQVVVNNAGEETLSGELDFEIVDPDTDESLAAEFELAAVDGTSFTVEPGGSHSVEFSVRAPDRVGTAAFRVTGSAGDLSDGELRPVPLLPGRMHLSQSRFVTLRDADRRELHFADLAADNDPTRIDESLIVTLDAQLFYSVLNALPYLVNYPYECTEQTLNRFLSSGIVSSVFDRYPSVARMAKKLSERDTRLETWDDQDPNRKLALEETPWLVRARGGDEPEEDLVRVLDPRIARAERRAALAKLEKAQTSVGGFPWWPGGPPSPYMTLYLLQGFSRALEFDVEVPREVVERAWSYVHRHYLDEWVREVLGGDCCWELVTFLNFVLSSYPDESWTGGVFSADDRRQMLEFSFRHWKSHSPRLKGYLALTLARAGRDEDARLVFDSIMDSAKTTQDEGTFWAPEDRAWLWYNDTVESHSLALRALAELSPDDARRHGLVQWLLLNKKLNHWKSTRATAEAIYSLVHYLEAEGTLGAREEATVNIGARVETFVFEPDSYTGRKVQVVVEGDEVDPATDSTIVVEKETPGFLFASATWHFSTEELPEEARGDFFSVERTFFRRSNQSGEWVLEPLAEGAEITPGDQVEVHLSIRAKHAAEYVHLRDPRGAGFEPESTTSRYKWNLGIGWYEEIRDSGANFFFEWLPAGEYTFKYRLRANLAGTFKVGPATLQSMYAPEFTGYSSGALLSVER